MSKPCIICVAITGSVPTKSNNPAVPISVEEQIESTHEAFVAGGHTRTGLEDNMRLDRNTLAPSNAAPVRRTVDLCDQHERPVATWQQACDILQLNGTGD